MSERKYTGDTRFQAIQNAIHHLEAELSETNSVLKQIVEQMVIANAKDKDVNNNE